MDTASTASQFETIVSSPTVLVMAPMYPEKPLPDTLIDWMLAKGYPFALRFVARKDSFQSTIALIESKLDIYKELPIEVLSTEGVYAFGTGEFFAIELENLLDVAGRERKMKIVFEYMTQNSLRGYTELN